VCGSAYLAFYFIRAHSEGNGGEAAALFTLKFDEAGNWKIIKMHQMSKEEIDAAE
jgi:hypothetical protein